MENLENLLTCPFCGSAAVLEAFPARKGFEASIHCNNCLAKMCSITYDTLSEAIESVTKSWNNRANAYDQSNEIRLINAIPLEDWINKFHSADAYWAISMLKNAPTVNAKPVKKAKWVYDGKNSFCNHCGHSALCDDMTGEEVLSDVCPYCGADMK